MSFRIGEDELGFDVPLSLNEVASWQAVSEVK